MLLDFGSEQRRWIGISGKAEMENDNRPALRFDDRHISWRPFASALPPGPDGSHPSDGLRYWVLGVNRVRQTVDILFKLDPGACCQAHRHIGPTDTLVIEGEQLNLHLIEGNWKVVEVRPSGFLATNEGDHFHREAGGPQGAIIYLHMGSIDGAVWEVLNDGGKVVAIATLDDFQMIFDHQTNPAAPLPGTRSSL
jgi:hypothetical protein